MTSPLPAPLPPEIPVASSVQAAPNLVIRGAKEGAVVALKMATAYVCLAPIVITAWGLIESGQTPLMRSIFSEYVFFIVASLLVGGIPALVIGVAGGVIIAMAFRQLLSPVSLTAALTIGIACGGFLLIPLTVVVIRLLLGNGLSPDFLSFFALIWGAPSAFALVGFAWVGYRLNLLVPR